MLTVLQQWMCFTQELMCPYGQMARKDLKCVWWTCRISRAFTSSSTHSHEGSMTKQQMEKISSAQVTNDQDMGQRMFSRMDPHSKPYTDEQYIPQCIYNMEMTLPYVSHKKMTPMRTCRCWRVEWNCLWSTVSKYSPAYYGGILTTLALDIWLW